MDPLQSREKKKLLMRGENNTKRYLKLQKQEILLNSSKRKCLEFLLKQAILIFGDPQGVLL